MLTRRHLNRTLLRRQMLLDRVDHLDVFGAVEHLVGLQAQEPLDPYVGLWSRLAGFEPDHLGSLVASQELVRIVTWRGTVHLHTAADAVAARASIQTWAEQRARPTNDLGRALTGVDIVALRADALAWFAVEPRNGSELKQWLVERLGEGRDLSRVADYVRYALPLAQMPPRGVWGRSLRATWSPLPEVTGRPLPESTPAAEAEIVRRYLGAYGPATAADIASWSGWTGVKARLDRLGDELVRYRHEDTGRVLFDLVGGQIIDPDTPAPVRFLPEFDDVFLAHADRSRIVPDGRGPVALTTVATRPRTLLVDGMIDGLWAIDRHESRAVLRVDPFSAWTTVQRAQVVAEGEALLAWQAPDRRPEVEVNTDS